MIELNSLEEVNLEPTAEDIRKVNVELIKENFSDVVISSNVSDSLKLYMKEVGKYQLLSSEEEIKLGHDIANGYTEARDKLFNHNMRLVINIAKRYIGQGCEFLDLIQEGNSGLLKAIDKWDASKGYKFSTYAIWWIRQFIVRYIENYSKLVRIPTYMHAKIREVRKLENQYREEYGEEGSDEELAEISDSFDAEEIHEIRRYMVGTVSLDSTLSDDSYTTLGDTIADEEDDYAEEADKSNQLDLIRGMLDKIPEKEALAIKYSFGFDVDKQLTYDEIGEIIGVSGEMVRQYKNKGIVRIKSLISKL